MSRRAEVAIRAGTVISWARMVPVVAFAWKVDARRLAARVRLSAIAAQTSHAPLAANDPDGRWASGPCLGSAMTCSTIAWPRWQCSAWTIGSGLSVNTVAVAGDEFVLAGGGGESSDSAHDQPGGDVAVEPAVGEHGVAGFGDLGVGHQPFLLLVPDRLGIADLSPSYTRSRRPAWRSRRLPSPCRRCRPGTSGPRHAAAGYGRRGWSAGRRRPCRAGGRARTGTSTEAIPVSTGPGPRRPAGPSRRATTGPCRRSSPPRRPSRRPAPAPSAAGSPRLDPAPSPRPRAGADHTVPPASRPAPAPHTTPGWGRRTPPTLHEKLASTGCPLDRRHGTLDKSHRPWSRGHRTSDPPPTTKQLTDPG